MERHVEALEALKTLDKLMITPAEAAPVIGCDPHYIRLMARSDPEKLGFPVTVVGTRTKIPRIPFIRFVEGMG
ncbi:MAG: hypothetical protein ACI4MM_08635 [Candidatus Ventricola sp.]